MQSRWKAPSILLALALAGCTAILDAGRHRGGDAGEPQADAEPRDAEVREDSSPPDSGPPDGGDCDRDGDGHRAPRCGGDDCDDDDASVYPNASPICGNGRLEGCPGDTAVPAGFFGASSAGILAPRTLASDASLGPRLASASTTLGGGGLGTATVMVIADGGARRYDLGLDDPGDALVVPVLESGGADMADADVIAISLSSIPSANRIAAVITGPTGFWEGVFDAVSGDRPMMGRNLVLMPPALAMGYAKVFRTDDGTERAISWEITEGAAAFRRYPSDDVPVGDVRSIVAGSHLMLQPADGELVFFWQTWDTITPVQRTTMSGLTGRAAFAAYSGTGPSHLLAWANGADVEISPIECGTSGDEAGCALPARLPGSEIRIRTGAMSAEALDARTLSSGRALILILERRSGGDVLSVQPVDADGRVTIPRIAVLDLSSGGRVVDATLTRVETTTGTSALVSALVGDDPSTPTRAVTAGLRACAAD